MNKSSSRRSVLSIIIIIVLILVILFIGWYSSAIGWYGYEKWKPRRSTFGDRVESIERNVFVKDLQYKSSVNLDSFHIYIEKGYRYGYHSSKDTRLITDSEYPFQVSFTDNTGVNKINYYLISKKNDSVSNLSLLIKKAYLNDTLFIGIDKYTTKWDSIGYIKVWDRRK